MDWTPVFTALVVSIISTLITAQLSLRHFRVERWWKRKSEAYDDVISAMEHLCFIAGSSINAEMRGREPTKFEKQQGEKWEASRRKVTRAIHLSGYLLSDDAKLALEEYLKEMRKSPENYFDALDLGFSASTKCLEKITKIARRDLGIGKRRWNK